MAVVWIAQGYKSEEWPVSAWILFGAVISAGIFSCCLAIASSNEAIKKCLDSSGNHEGEILIAIVAAPVYWIGSFLRSRRADDENP